MPAPITTLSKRPNCQVCQGNWTERPAAYAAHIRAIGCWAYVCDECFRYFGCSTGVGLGQRIEVAPWGAR